MWVLNYILGELELLKMLSVLCYHFNGLTPYIYQLKSFHFTVNIKFRMCIFGGENC